MTRYWKKLGQLYVPSGRRHPKLLSHAANPLPVHLEGDVYRIFYSGRDERNRSSVGAVDIDVAQREITAEHDLPFFEHGPAGSFYADGVSIGNCYETHGVRYMLFMGWQAPEGEHWRGDIGRLVLTDKCTLELDSDLPFMGTTAIDPISLSYPWVLPRQEGGFDMWYGSTHTWNAGNGEMLHALHHASSDDGRQWQRNGLAVPYILGSAQAFSRPTVLPGKDGGLDMWFSFRSGSGEKYRIGHAKSDTATGWSLDLENCGISVADEGWDSEMIEYPFVFDHKGERYMLYNGNGYGKTGFGLAILDER
ncbi:MAG: hypothetical protein ACTHJ1_13285 [Bordetella sp.]|uniref:hypothetical protein n=1 Tax=Bordetella sp. TaxID=28081 RepID=UPI003F7BF835